MPGTLYVVATPIGNLEDLTFRALRVLREVDAIAAEDTRRTSKLLAHYAVSKPLVSLHAHNEHRETRRLVSRLQRGDSIALVSDAGTPAIADPGAGLVRAARLAGVAVHPVPGPSAIAAALSVAGVKTDSFLFLGFPPAGGTARDRWLEQVWQAKTTVVFFEAPHRIRRTVADLADLLVGRPLLLVRELTKIHESFVTCQTSPNAEALPEQGEYVGIVEPPEDRRGLPAPSDLAILDAFGRITDAGFSQDEAATLTACLLGSSPAAIRKIVKKARFAAARGGSVAP